MRILNTVGRMPIFIMPVGSGQICPYLVVVLGIIHDLDVEVYHTHTFCTATQPGQRAYEWDADLRESNEPLARWPTCISKDYS